MRHGGRADLAFLEALGDGLITGHQADGGGQRRRASTELDQRGQSVEVEGARVDLTNGVKDAVEAEAFSDFIFQGGQCGLITVKQIQHVLGGTHRALDAAQWVAGNQVFYTLDAQQHLVRSGGEALTQGRCLCGDVVGATCHDQRLVLGGLFRSAGGNGNGLVSHDLQRLQSLQLFNVFSQVTRGHALVNVLGASQVAELFNAGLHIVASNTLTCGNGVEVNLVDDLLVCLDSALRHLNSAGDLSLQNGNPELALEDDLVLRAPQLRQSRRGVSVSKDVCDLLFLSHALKYSMTTASAVI